MSNALIVFVGVHQGSVLTPFLFNLVKQEATKQCHKGVIWDILYAEHQISTEESKEEVEQEYQFYEAALAGRGLKTNVDKTKILVSAKDCLTPTPSGSVCSRSRCPLCLVHSVWEMLSAGVAEGCGLRQIRNVLKSSRLSWYGHVRRREDGNVLATIRDSNVDSRRPRGIPQKNLDGQCAGTTDVKKEKKREEFDVK